MADDNDNRLLALAALELVRRHDDLRLIELNSHIHDLTLELGCTLLSNYSVITVITVSWT